MTPIPTPIDLLISSWLLIGAALLCMHVLDKEPETRIGVISWGIPSLIWYSVAFLTAYSLFLLETEFTLSALGTIVIIGALIVDLSNKLETKLRQIKKR